MAQHDGPPHHRTADDEYVATPGSSYEHTDANVGTIVRFGFWLVVMALVVHVAMGLMYAMLIEQAGETAEQRYPLAVSGDAKLPPEPRLQQFPEQEMRAYEQIQKERLASYGWVNEEAGVAHIPIDEAMRLTLERGLPARAPDPEAASEAGLLASDPSSGRLMEKRRQ
jgi:hypothetical protein